MLHCPTMCGTYDHTTRQSGVSLILTLAAITLVSVLVVTFLSRSVSMRKVVYSSVGQSKASELSHSTAELVIDDLVQEIQAGSQPIEDADGNLIYLRPNQPATMVPALSGLPSTVPAPPNLVKVSRSGVPFWPTAAHYAGSNGSAIAGPVRSFPGISTGTTPRNGQALRGRFWDAPHLTPTAVFSDNSIPVPDWILLARRGPIGPANVASVPSMQVLADSSPANANYIIGRYAYTIYEVGGALDINVAGHHSAATVTPDDHSARATQATADLRKIFVDAAGDPLGATADLQTWTDALVAWRNRANFNTDDFTAFQRSGLDVGHLVPLTGDQTFINRQDLIDFWIKNIPPAATDRSKRAGLASLTTFSRGVNQPSWDPLKVIERQGLTAGNYNLNKAFLEMRVQTPFNRADGSEAKAGEPLILKRYPLSHIAKLEESTGVVGVGSEIHKLFGLTRAGINQPWNYDANLIVRGAIFTKPSWDLAARMAPFRLLTLEELARGQVILSSGESSNLTTFTPREPNFFELIQASVLNGRHPSQHHSTGSLGHYNRFSDRVMLFQDNNDRPLGRHVLQIGANIIDQADTDGYPTQIYTAGVTDYDVYGIEDLPYLSNIYQLIYRWADNSNFSFHFVPQLWNPHRRSTQHAPQTYPTEFRFRANGPISPNPVGSVFVDLTRGTPSEQQFAHHYPNRFAWRSFQRRLGRHSGASPYSGYSELVIASKAFIGHQATPTSTAPGTEAVFMNFDPTENFFRDTSMDITQELTAQKIQVNFPANEVRDRHETASYRPAPPASRPARDVHYFGIHYDTFDARVNIPYMPGPHTNGSITVPDFEAVNDVPNAGLFGPSANVWQGLTFTLDFKDAGGTWRPYSAWRRTYSGDLDQSHVYRFNAFSRDSNVFHKQLPDPRTTRFGPMFAWGWGRFNQTIFADTDTTSFGPNIGVDWSPSDTYSPWSTGNGKTANAIMQREPGNYFPAAINYNQYQATNGFRARYEDPDRVRRPADLYRTSLTPSNSPGHATKGNASNLARPIVLNRPFGSIAELGMVHRDLPFRSLDLWSDVSPDMGLLDAFRAQDAPLLLAAQINPNQVTKPVLEALLSGAVKDMVQNDVLTDEVTTGEVTLLANQLLANKNAKGPFVLSTGILENVRLTNKPETDIIKTRAETPVRALGDFSQTRVWNLMIDLVVQSGTYSRNSANLDQFNANGLKRVWVHVALDRLTGKVLETRMENVQERTLP